MEWIFGKREVVEKGLEWIFNIPFAASDVKMWLLLVWVIGITK